MNIMIVSISLFRIVKLISELEKKIIIFFNAKLVHFIQAEGFLPFLIILINVFVH